MTKELCGWVPFPSEVEKVINDPANKHPVFSSAGRRLMETYERKTTLLYEPLIWAKPDYRRGAQKIGDCVSWGAEFACTLLIAKEAYKARTKSRFLEAATEPIYGGSRVEIGQRKLGRGDGSVGAWAADWVTKFGVLFRKDYSTETGEPSHNLLTYSGAKAKDWGYEGCGGSRDGGKLDTIARLFPVKTISQIHNAEEAAAAIAGAKCPVTIASQYGTNMRRDANGYCQWNGSWAHQMVLVAVRFASNGEIEGFLCVQSWGPSVASGPHWPNDMPEGIKGCSWWIPTKDANRIFGSGDSWAFGDIDGWKIDKTDFTKILGPRR